MIAEHVSVNTRWFPRKKGWVALAMKEVNEEREREREREREERERERESVSGSACNL